MLGITIKDVVLALIAHEENGTEKFFLIRRKHNPFYDHWSFPGGRLENGETLEECAAREAREETGLEIDVINFIEMFSSKKRGRYGRYTRVHVFNCQLSEGMDPNSYVIDKEESYEGKWFSAQEITTPNFNIIPYLKKYLIENVAAN